MGNVDEFVAARSPSWVELETLLTEAHGRPSRLGADRVRRLGESYRAATADLALARRRFAGDPVVANLESLVRRSRVAVYHTAAARGSLRHYLTTGYWQRVRERPALLLVATVLLLLPTFLAGYWAWRDPGAASGLVPAAYQSITEPRTPGADLGVSVEEQAALATEIFTNNIRVTFLAFGGGMLLGFGTAYILIFNGMQIGAVAGLAIGAGNGRPFFELVTAHGVLELSCIIVSAAAGLRIAMAMIDPGHRPRGQALREEARAGIEVLIGTAGWLVVAGLVEGFVTPAGTGLETVIAVGVGLGVVYWGLVFWRGRPEPADRLDT